MAMRMGMRIGIRMGISFRPFPFPHFLTVPI